MSINPSNFFGTAQCTSKGLVYYTVFLTLTGMTCSWSRVTKPSRHPERSRRRSEESGETVGSNRFFAAAQNDREVTQNDREQEGDVRDDSDRMMKKDTDVGIIL